jgi:uncharacterized iron-regulated membrane protein
VPRVDVRGRARNYNWHKVTGFWIALPLAVIVTTGAVMAYPWANALLFRLAGSPVPARGQEGANTRRHGMGKHALPTGLDEAFAQATSDVQDWRSATLRLSMEAGALSFSVDRSEGGHPEKREQVSIDPKNAAGVASRAVRCFEPRPTMARLCTLCAYRQSRRVVG